MEAMNTDGTFDQSKRRPISELKSGFTYFAKDDVIFAKITPCFENGKGALLSRLASSVGFGSTEFHVLRTIQGLTVPKFLYYLTISGGFRRIGEAFMQGVAGQKRVTNDFVQNYRTPTPPVNEQISIIDFLDTKTAQIDDLIAKKERMIELLKEERMAVINQAVTKGLDPKVEMKDSGIEWLGKVPRAWAVKRLKFLAYINPSRLNSVSDNTQCVFIPMEAMNTDGTFDQSQHRPIAELKSGFTCFAKDDVIFAKITPCFENGKGALLSGLASDIGFGSTEFHVLRKRKGTTIPRFLYYLSISGSFRRLGEAFMQGVAGQKRVTNDFVRNFVISIPSLDEQKQIADFLDQKTTQIGAQIAREEKLVELLKEYRTALISEAVTGKIDVGNS
jgi:restriction endonuclease S subunit